MKKFDMAILAITVMSVSSVGGLVADAATSHHAQASMVKHTVSQKGTVPAWFLRDIQLAERVNPIIGANYILNYGETSVPNSPQMNRVWYGALSGHGKNVAFGYSWAGVYQQAKQAVSQPLTAINVLEQTKQGETTIGLLVPAISVDISNGDFVGFSNGQAILATDKSGTVYYSVYPVKGVSVPWSNLSAGSTATPNGVKNALYTRTQVIAVNKVAKQRQVIDPYLPTKLVTDDSFQRVGGFYKTMSLTYRHLGIYESSTPIVLGGWAIGSPVKLRNGLDAHWERPTRAANINNSNILEFKLGKTYIALMAPDKWVSQASLVRICESMSPLNMLK